eukprot:SAG22_NODE_3033_length_2010_cov_1.672423_3_plen_80_part_00
MAGNDADDVIDPDLGIVHPDFKNATVLLNAEVAELVRHSTVRAPAQATHDGKRVDGAAPLSTDAALSRRSARTEITSKH